LAQGCGTMRGAVLSLVCGFLANPSPAEKLEAVRKGIVRTLAANEWMADFEKPKIAELDAALKQPASKQEQVLAAYPEWEMYFGNKTDEERTALLVAVLQNKQSWSREQQLGIVEAPDFAGLPVVHVLEKAKGTGPLLPIALEFLDHTQSFLELREPAPVGLNPLEGTFSCPYCGAKCVEACVATRRGYRPCLVQCLQENPVSPVPTVPVVKSA